MAIKKESLQTINIKIPQELHKSIKVKSAEQSVKMVDIIVDAIKKGLSK